MLQSSSAEVRAVAAACLGDLAAAHPPLQPYLTQVPPSCQHQNLTIAAICGSTTVCIAIAGLTILQYPESRPCWVIAQVYTGLRDAAQMLL